MFGMFNLCPLTVEIMEGLVHPGGDDLITCMLGRGFRVPTEHDSF